MSINEILMKYTNGEADLEKTNQALKEAGAKYHLDPGKNALTEAEIRATTVGTYPDMANGWGLLDTGTGSHPEDRPHLFKGFYRSRFAQDTPGIGLGLPLAKSIVEVHGGTLEVESELGRGTAFTILLRNRPAPAIPTKL